MHVHIEFGTFPSDQCIEDGYQSLPLESVLTQPLRLAQDVQNAYEDVRERVMKYNPDVEVGLVTFSIEATHAELMLLARKAVSDGLHLYGIPVS